MTFHVSKRVINYQMRSDSDVFLVVIDMRHGDSEHKWIIRMDVIQVSQETPFRNAPFWWLTGRWFITINSSQWKGGCEDSNETIMNTTQNNSSNQSWSSWGVNRRSGILSVIIVHFIYICIKYKSIVYWLINKFSDNNNYYCVIWNFTQYNHLPLKIIVIDLLFISFYSFIYNGLHHDHSGDTLTIDPFHSTTIIPLVVFNTIHLWHISHHSFDPSRRRKSTKRTSIDLSSYMTWAAIVEYYYSRVPLLSITGGKEEEDDTSPPSNAS